MEVFSMHTLREPEMKVYGDACIPLAQEDNTDNRYTDMVSNVSWARQDAIYWNNILKIYARASELFLWFKRKKHVCKLINPLVFNTEKKTEYDETNS